MTKTSSVAVSFMILVAGVVPACAAEPDDPTDSSEQAIAPAFALGACLAEPPCAAAVIATLGYVVHSVSQIRASDRPKAQRAANDWAEAGGDPGDPRTGCGDHEFEHNKKHPHMPIDGPAAGGRYISYAPPRNRFPNFRACKVVSPTELTCPLIVAGKEYRFTCRRHLPGGKGKANGEVCKFHCYLDD